MFKQSGALFLLFLCVYTGVASGSSCRDTFDYNPETGDNDFAVYQCEDISNPLAMKHEGPEEK